jgi:hypothetical protein
LITLADLGFGLLEMLLSKHGNKLPAQLVLAAQAAVDAWAIHRADVVTKEALEAQRG